MFAPDDPTAQANYEIDPLKSPYFQILQPQSGNDNWLEVGVVWTVGSSRTNATEYWYLYNTVQPNQRRAAYTWPGYNANGAIAGTSLRLVPATAPMGQTPDTLQAYLERDHGCTITAVLGTMTAG